MGVSAISQAVVKKSEFAPGGAVLLYDPAVERVGVLLKGLDDQCVAVPVGANDIYQVLTGLLQSASVHTIHLLGHGAPGGIFFENVFINGTVWDGIVCDAALDRAPRSIQTINFWSCETGRGEIGMKFLKQVADSTGATVHGSDRKVGSAEHGGSWELGRHAAPRPPFTAEALGNFEGTLDHEHDGIRIASVGVDIPGGTYAPGQAVNITVTMSEPVTAGSSLTLTLSNGDTVVVEAAVDGTTLASTGYVLGGYTGTFFVSDGVNGGGTANLTPVTPDEGFTDFYPSDDFDNIVETAMISVAGTTGDDPAAVTAADISVNAPPGTIAAGDQVQVRYDSSGAGVDSITDVTFDLSQFVGDHYVVSYSDGGSGWSPVEGGVYEYSFLMPGDAPTSTAMGGGAGPVTDNQGPGYGNDDFYARVFVSVESETGGLVSTNNMVADDETFYIDSIGPEVVDIDLEPGSDTGALNDDGLTNADTLHFRVEFSEPLAGLGVEDFWAGGGEVTAVEELTGESGTVYRVTVDAEDGAGSVSLQAETMGIYDVAGNQISMTGASATGTIDDSIDRSLSSKARIETADEFTNADTLAWVVSFDEDMDPSTINPEDFQVQTTEAVGYTVLATTSTVTQANVGDQTIFRVEATGGDLTDFNGTVQLGLVGGATSFADMAGNADDHTADSDSDGDLATNQTYTLDNGAAVPTVSLSSDTGVAGDGIASSGGLSVTGTESGSTLEYSTDPSAGWHSDQAGLSLAEGENTVYVRQIDLVGNVSDPASITFTLDTTGPGAASVARFDGETGVDSDGIVDFTVTLSEPVDPATFSTADLAVTGASDVVTVEPQTGAATDTFKVSVPYDSDAGSMVSVAIAAGADFADVAGNLGGLGSSMVDTDGDGIDEQVYDDVSAQADVDNVGPAATISVSESLVDAGNAVTVSVSFTEPLGGSPSAADVIGALSTPDLVLSGTPTVDGNTYTATFVAATATNGIDNQISLAAGAFSDAAGNSTSAATSASYDVDSVSPVITGFDAAGADGTYGPGDTISIDATASESLVAGSAIRATLTNGEVVTLTADTGGTVLSGSYVVDGTDTSLTDLDVSSFALGDGVTPGTVPADLFGNEMTSTTLPADLIANSHDIIIDTGKPLVTAIERLAADDSNIDTDGVTSTTPMTFKVSFSEAIDASTVTAGDFVASNGTVGTVTEDSSTLVTDAVAGSGYTSFLVEVTSASDGEVALGLVDGSSFTDIAGNTSYPVG